MGSKNRSENCCYSFVLKTVTLFFIYLELTISVFLLVSSIIFKIQEDFSTIIEINDQETIATEFSENGDNYTTRPSIDNSQRNNINKIAFAFSAAIGLGIIIWGLFGVLKHGSYTKILASVIYTFNSFDKYGFQEKKPTMLIPYLIFRILHATVFTILIGVIIFRVLFSNNTEKNILMMLTISNNFVSSSLINEDNDPNDSAFKLVSAIVIMGILIIILDIYVIKVIYGYGRGLKKTVSRNKGFVFSPTSYSPNNDKVYITQYPNNKTCHLVPEGKKSIHAV